MTALKTLEHQIKLILGKKPFTLDVKKVEKINGGGCSKNYICICVQDKFFIKIFPQRYKEHAERLFKILKEFDLIPFAFSQTPYILLGTEIMLVQKFISGKELSARELDERRIDILSNRYKDFLKKSIKLKALSREQITPEIYFNECMEKLEKITNKAFSKNIKQKVLQIFQNIPQLKSQTQIIHGDFSVNNFLYDEKTETLTLVDFESLRKGYVIEDIAKLVLNALLKHSVFFLPKEKLKKMMMQINHNFHFSKEEWLYGVKMYYLQSVLQRLHLPKFQNSWRKKLIYMRKLQMFETICQTLDEIY